VTDGEDLRGRIAALEARLAEVEDRAAIRDLRFRYHAAVNERDFDAIGGLFVEDGFADLGASGSARGRDAIVALYRQAVGHVPFLRQFIHNHLVTLEGDCARGRSDLEARLARDGESIVVAACFDDEYVREPSGAWRFRSLRLAVDFAVPLAEGWAQAVGADADHAEARAVGADADHAEARAVGADADHAG
jgi:ketosteroid isomerase-like protein